MKTKKSIKSIKAIFFSVGIGLAAGDERAQFILKSENVQFRYIEDKSMTPSTHMLGIEDKVKGVLTFNQIFYNQIYSGMTKLSRLAFRKKNC